MALLVHVRTSLNSENPEVITYGDICFHLFGVWGSRILNAFLIFTQIGFCCVYVVFEVDNTSTLTCFLGLGTQKPGEIPPCEPSINKKIWVIPWFFVFVLLSWIRSLKGVAYVSNFSNLAIIFSMIVILTGSAIQLHYNIEQGNGLDVAIGIVPSTFAVMLSSGVYAFEGIGTIIPIVTGMKSPEKFPYVLVFIMVISTINYVLFGLIPYLAFGSETTDVITENIRNFAECYPPNCERSTTWIVLYYIVTFALILTIMGTFPIQLFVVTDVIEEWFFNKYEHLRKNRFWITNLLRTLLVCLICVVAISIPDFGLLIALVGSLGSASLQFIFPVAFVLQMYWPTLSIPKIGLYLFYICFGALGGFLGFVQTVQSLIEEIS
jgi:solute carrier family 36 (proton-coupled amino acid transporter)